MCEYSENQTVIDDDTLMLHLQSEFADLKSTSINQQLPWRTWWQLKKEKYKYLYHAAITLLSLAASEAAGNNN